LVEERWRDRVQSGASAEAQLDAHLYAGMPTRGGLCICPDLSKWISEELQREASVMKEKRKAREERALVRPKGGGAEK
jgi:hypothetical protein